MQLGTISFARPSRRRSASRRVALLSPPQQFESRCLLAAASGLPFLEAVADDGLALTQFDAGFDQGDLHQDTTFELNDGLASSFSDFDFLFDSETFSDAELFAEFDSSSGFGSFAEEFVFEDDRDELAGADLPESFALVPESIRDAVNTLSTEREGVSIASDWAGLDSDDLRIISLQVTASSGVTLPVDLFVWDSGADSALSADFLAQVEVVLNETLKDVLATGGMTSISDSGPFSLLGDDSAGLASSVTATSYADTYGIQPLEIYVDVSQNEFSSDGSVYISGVTVVSEDPLDPEFLIFDEYFFVAEDFGNPFTEFQEASVAEQSPGVADVISEPDDGSPLGTSTATSAAATEEPELAGSASSESTPAAAVSEADEPAGRSRVAESGLADAEREYGSDSAASGHQEQSRRRDNDADVETRRSRHAQRFAQRMAAGQSDSDTGSESRRQRFRIRVAQVARQIAEAACSSSTQRRVQSALPGSTAAFAVNWASHLAAFAQPAFNEQLLGLSGPEAERDGNDSGPPTCAQIASATGAFLIAASATAQTVRQRQKHRNGQATGRRSHVSQQDTSRVANDDTLA